MPMFAALMLAASPTPVAPGNSASIIAAADAFDRAQLTKDGAAIGRMVLDDLIFIDSSGKRLGKKEFIAGWTAPGDRFDPITLIDRTVTPLGRDAAVVGAEVNLCGSSDGARFMQPDPVRRYLCPGRRAVARGHCLGNADQGFTGRPLARAHVFAHCPPCLPWISSSRTAPTSNARSATRASPRSRRAAGARGGGARAQDRDRQSPRRAQRDQRPLQGCRARGKGGARRRSQGRRRPRIGAGGRAWPRRTRRSRR